MTLESSLMNVSIARVAKVRLRGGVALATGRISFLAAASSGAEETPVAQTGTGRLGQHQEDAAGRRVEEDHRCQAASAVRCSLRRAWHGRRRGE